MIERISFTECQLNSRSKELLEFTKYINETKIEAVVPPLEL